MDKEDLRIKIPDPSLDALKLYKDETGEIKGLLKVAIQTFNWIVTFVIGVMLVGFLTLLFTVVTLMINSWSSYQAENNSSSEQKAIDEIKIQQDRMMQQLEAINSSKK